MSGFQGGVDFTQLIAQLQGGNSLLGAIQQVLKDGILVNPVYPSYTVAALPASAANGANAFASNGRKPAEGAGVGTGVPVFWNSATSQWFSYLSGAVVTA